MLINELVKNRFILRVPPPDNNAPRPPRSTRERAEELGVSLEGIVPIFFFVGWK